MVPTLLLLASVRGWLARIAGMHWARIGGLDLVLPVALLLVIWHASSLLGRDLAGIPFGLVWAVATASVVLAVRVIPAIAAASDARAARARSARIPMLRLALPAAVVVSWVLYDILFWGQTVQLYDLNVYLGAAARWLNGGQPYLTAALTAWPSTARADFFLYPPPLLPVFGALSRLP
ncbi:MAG: hypothetical protein ACHQ01_10790, partial [Candidatus Limnocylindrales bacterium]